MVAEELGRQGHCERVVDLEADDVLHALAAKPVEPARFRQGHEHPAMAIGCQRQMAGTVEQQPAGGGVERWQVVLAEDEDAIWLEAAAGVVGEERPCLGIGGGTGHDRQRHIAAIPPSNGDELAEQHFEEIGFRYRSDAAQSLWPMAAKTGALSAGHEDRADLSRAQCLAATADGIRRQDAIRGIAQPQAGGRDGGGEVDHRLAAVAAACGESLHLCDQRPVDSLQLGRERPLRRLSEPVPEGEQMWLPHTRERGDEIRWGIHPLTHLQNMMHRSGKPTKITV